MLSLFNKIKNLCISFYKFCKSYWQYVIGLILLLVGYVLGRRNDDSKVIRSDLDLVETASKEKLEAVEQLSSKLSKDKDELHDRHVKDIENINKNKEHAIDNLGNNSKKLDTILGEKYNLKKGG